jgi:hypothetical protein
VASSGRTPLSNIEKAKRKASRDYRKIIEKRNLTYDEIYDKRAGEKHMGRKPISKEEQIKRAKKEFLKSLSIHRAEARTASIVLPSLRVLLREYRVYRANDSAGRKPIDRTIALYKYREKERAKLDQAIAEPCPHETYNGRGRKPMSKAEKLEHYQNKIRETEEEIRELIKDAPESKKIYYKLREARLEARSRKQALKNNPDDEMVLHYLEESKAEVLELESKYNAQLKIEKKEELASSSPSMTDTLPSVTTPLPNSTTDTMSTNINVVEAGVIINTNSSDHEVIDLMKSKQLELDKELKVLEELEKTLLKKAQLIEQKKSLQQAIENRQQQLI